MLLGLLARSVALAEERYLEAKFGDEYTSTARAFAAGSSYGEPTAVLAEMSSRSRRFTKPRYWYANVYEDVFTANRRAPMTSEPALPPGPRQPAVVQSVKLYRDPLGFLEGCRRRYGPIFRMRFVGFGRWVYVADPALARQVYAADRTIGRAGEARADFLEPIVGENSLLCTEDEHWLRHRKLLGPAFHRDHVDGYADEIARIAAERIDRWPLDEPFALRLRMLEITLEVILRLVFGITEAERLQRLREVLPRVAELMESPLFWVLPPSLWASERSRHRLSRVMPQLRRLLKARAEVDALLYDEIACRRRDPDGLRSDVLSMLLHARDENGRGMGDAELRDELITLLEAGHETTATALAWAFERLLRHPQALAKATEEAWNGGERYLDAVVRETLRSRPVVFDTPRLLAGSLELGDYVVPAGWYVAPVIPSVQLAAWSADEPEAFRPERFLEGTGPRDGWIPFGGGKRHCLGSHLALLEMRVVITEVLRRMRLEAPRLGPERQRVHHVTLIPSEGTLVIARRRAERQAPAAPAVAAT